MKQIIFQKFIFREDLINNRHIMYVFGDNDIRQGHGGQAKEMRGESNAFGIRVKKAPQNNPAVYYTDKDYEENIEKINKDFIALEKYLEAGKLVVIPLDGIGTGLARLKELAPRTLQYVTDRINQLTIKYKMDKK